MAAASQDSLRQPPETGSVVVARANHYFIYLARARYKIMQGSCTIANLAEALA